MCLVTIQNMKCLRVLEALRSHFRPEFLNRVDDIILFHTLSRSELRQIIIQIKRKALADQKITYRHRRPRLLGGCGL